jgi:hypothetical protein
MRLHVRDSNRSLCMRTATPAQEWDKGLLRTHVFAGSACFIKAARSEI